jgi:hypothetical protein
MAVSDHVGTVSKLRAKILTVDPSRRIIEAAANDAYARRIALFDVPQGFVWPQEGEEWSIYEENGYWRLGNRYLDPEENDALQDFAPGVAVAPTNSKTLDGGTNVVVYGDAADGQTLAWDDIQNKWTPVTPSVGGGGGISTFLFTQSVASAVWVVVHGLGRHPSTTVIDSGGNVVEAAIAHNSLNQLTITFSTPISGTVYLV